MQPTLKQRYCFRGNAEVIPPFQLIRRPQIWGQWPWKAPIPKTSSKALFVKARFTMGLPLELKLVLIRAARPVRRPTAILGLGRPDRVSGFGLGIRRKLTGKVESSGYGAMSALSFEGSSVEGKVGSASATLRQSRLTAGCCETATSGWKKGSRRRSCAE